MNKLQQVLQSCVSESINEFIDQLHEGKLITDKEKVLSIWNSQVTDDLKILETKKPSPAKKPVEKKPKDASKKTCIYAYVKGDKEGTTCGAKASDESETGNFCKKHITHEKKADEPSPVEPKKVKSQAAATPSAPKKSSTVVSKKKIAPGEQPRLLQPQLLTRKFQLLK